MRSEFRRLLSAFSIAIVLGASASHADEPSSRPKFPRSEPDFSFNAPSPLIVGGFRFQTVDRGDRPDLFFGGVNLLLFKTAAGDEGAFWSFLSPGLHYQSSSEHRLALSVAPVSYVGKTGLAFSVQIFPLDFGRSGGLFGASIGYHFF